MRNQWSSQVTVVLQMKKKMHLTNQIRVNAFKMSKLVMLLIRMGNATVPTESRIKKVTRKNLKTIQMKAKLKMSKVRTINPRLQSIRVKR